jgi:hypothetical protein
MPTPGLGNLEHFVFGDRRSFAAGRADRTIPLDELLGADSERERPVEPVTWHPCVSPTMAVVRRFVSAAGRPRGNGDDIPAVFPATKLNRIYT